MDNPASTKLNSSQHPQPNPSPPTQPPTLLRLPTSVLQHIATLCPTDGLRNLRATCSGLRAVLQPNTIRLECRLHRDDQEPDTALTWQQELSMSRALASKWPGTCSAMVAIRAQQCDQSPETDREATRHVMDEAAAQLVHWTQLQRVSIEKLFSQKLVATVVATCTALQHLELRFEALQGEHLHLSLQHLSRCSSLRSLELHEFAWDAGCETALGQLTKLQALQLYLDEAVEADATALCNIFNSMWGLTDLMVACEGATAEWRIGPLAQLQKLELQVSPQVEITGCPLLTHLSLLSLHPVCILGTPRLPCLQNLDLPVDDLGPAELAWMAACCPQLTSLKALQLRVVSPLKEGLQQLQELQVEVLGCAEQALLADLMPGLTKLNVGCSMLGSRIPPAFLSGHPALACLELREMELLDAQMVSAVLSCPQLTCLRAKVLHVPTNLTAATAVRASLRELHLQQLRCSVLLAHLAPQLTWLDVADLSHTPPTFLHPLRPSSLRVISTKLQWEEAQAGVLAMPASATSPTAPKSVPVHDGAAASMHSYTALAAHTALASHTAGLTHDAGLVVGLVLQGAEDGGSQAGSTSRAALQAAAGRVPPAWLRGCGSSITHLSISGLGSRTAAAQVMRLLPWLPAVQVLTWEGLYRVGNNRICPYGLIAMSPMFMVETMGTPEVQALLALAPVMVRGLRQLREVELRRMWDVVADTPLSGVPQLTAWLQALSMSSSLRVVRIPVGSLQKVLVADAVRQQAAVPGWPLPFKVEVVMY